MHSMEETVNLIPRDFDSSYAICAERRLAKSNPKVSIYDHIPCSSLYVRGIPRPLKEGRQNRCGTGHTISCEIAQNSDSLRLLLVGPFRRFPNIYSRSPFHTEEMFAIMDDIDPDIEVFWKWSVVFCVVRIQRV